ncbi:MAG: exosome complex RNA-binding protein Rrp4 [Candidatus Hodarchaeota archaeon]
MKVLVEHHQLVIPGDLLATGNQLRRGEGCYREKKGDEYHFYAERIGLAEVHGQTLTVVPLEGRYIPREGDIVIGKITNVGLTSWRVDIRTVIEAVLTASNVVQRQVDPLRTDISRYLALGDYIKAKVIAYDRTRDPLLTMHGDQRCRKLSRGRLVEIDAVKVPRVIGKKGSMISLIKRKTRSRLFVGQNGRILIQAPTLELELINLEALLKIQNESHTSGLTNRIEQFLNEKIAQLKELEKENDKATLIKDEEL